MNCPRCKATLHAVEGESGVHQCWQCRGSFVPRETLRQIDAVLAQLPLHQSEAMRAETRFGGVMTCAGCGAVPVTFPFFEVLIDWCVACGGVWFDAGEIDDLRASIAALRREGGGAGVRHFRQQAAEAVTIGTVTCASCKATVPLNEAWMIEAGAACNPCGTKAFYEHLPEPEVPPEQAEGAKVRTGFAATLRRLLALDPS